jgi:hypothetical protein
MQTTTSATAANMQILIPQSFESGKQYLPIGEQYSLNGKDIPAIPKFLSPPSGGGTSILGSVGGQLTWTLEPPSGGTFVLGSVNGQLTWLATEACE